MLPAIEAVDRRQYLVSETAEHLADVGPEIAVVFHEQD